MAMLQKLDTATMPTSMLVDAELNNCFRPSQAARTAQAKGEASSCSELHCWSKFCDHLQELMRCTPPLAHVLRVTCTELVRCKLHRWRTCCAHPQEIGAMYSTAGARAAIKARAGAVNSATGARAEITHRSWCDVLHRWRTCCDKGTGWCSELHHWRTCCDHPQ